jgi:chorismate mutase
VTEHSETGHTMTGHTMTGQTALRPPAPQQAAPRQTPAPSPAPVPVAGPDGLVAARRRRIDELDARLIGLVRERMAVSGEIQAARIGSGGRRVHLAREMEVLRTYGDALGRPGTALAMTLLELCRGRI